MSATRWWGLSISVGLIAIAALFAAPTLQAQEPTVDVIIDFPKYDVVYVAEFLDITTRTLSANIPDFRFEAKVAGGQTIEVYLKINATALLKGDTQPQEACVNGARSNNFTLAGSRSFTSRDLQSLSGANEVNFDCQKNTVLEQRLKDHAKRYPTAPVGKYMITVAVHSAATNNLLGSESKTLDIVAASVAEVQIALIEPQPGSSVPTPFPTFSWTSDVQNLTLSVYEKLPIHRSPEEAITGLPHLKIELQNQATFTYPATGSRRLEEGKSYFWFVEGDVFTNQGIQRKRSEIWLFRVRTSTALAELIERLFLMLGGQAAGTHATLLQFGWTPLEPITLDGRTMTPEELRALVNKLTSENKPYTISVETQ